MGHIFIGDIERIILKKVIDPHEKIGNRMEPGEPRIVLQQIEKPVDGSYRPDAAFVGRLLSDDERSVEAYQSLADCQHDPPERIHRHKRCRFRS